MYCFSNGNAEHVKGEKLVWIFVFTVILVNFCFQVVFVGGLLWENIWTFDVVFKCLSACLLLSKPLLEHVELDKRKKPSVNICFHHNVRQFLLSRCYRRLFREYIWTFDVVLNCLSACFLLSKPLLEHAELDKRKNHGVNFFHCNVSQFLLSSCPWTPFSRIHSNFWCSFKVPERLRLISKLHLGHAELEMKGKTCSDYLFPFYC